MENANFLRITSSDSTVASFFIYYLPNAYIYTPRNAYIYTPRLSVHRQLDNEEIELGEELKSLQFSLWSSCLVFILSSATFSLGELHCNSFQPTLVSMHPSDNHALDDAEHKTLDLPVYFGSQDP